MDIAAGDKDSKEIYATGYLRDGFRRIDMILVSKECKDKDIEKIKKDFITNCLDMGLQFEVEGGIHPSNADLLFMKIHAPDYVLKKFGFFYNVRKYFKSSHIELLSSDVHLEKECIKLMRRMYSGPISMTNMERSTIVYKILLSIPFGTPNNHVGVNFLLENDIFLDMFPLHDGPCHLVQGQHPLNTNGRQALNYIWCYRVNIFQRTPIHLIREYFGERLGFLFAFYSYYNNALLILSLFSIPVFVTNFYTASLGFQKVVLSSKTFTGGSCKVPSTAESDLMVCPKCNDYVACPFRKMSDYTNELKCKELLDNPINVLLIYVLMFWAFLFKIFWRRKEYYLYWMWEGRKRDAKVLIRPRYRDVPVSGGTTQKLTGEAVPKKGDKLMGPSKKLMNKLNVAGLRETRFVALQQFLLMTLVLGIVVFGYVPMMMVLNHRILKGTRKFEKDYKVTTKLEQFNHFTIMCCGCFNGLFISIMEKLWWHIWKYIVRIVNPRTEWLYEEIHFDYFCVNLVINFIMIFYYAFVKQLFFVAPASEKDFVWNMPLGLGVTNCGLFSCTDEIFIFLIATFKFKYCFQELFKYIGNIVASLVVIGLWLQRTRNSFHPHRFTTYRKRKFVLDALDKSGRNNITGIGDETPVWEREMRLRPINEDTISKIYMSIFLQYAMATFFLTSFQLGPIISFLYNIWEIKYLATLFVKHSRRPLLTQTCGLGDFESILLLLTVSAPIVNIFYISFHNMNIYHQYKKRHIDTQKTGLAQLTEVFMTMICTDKFGPEQKKYLATVTDAKNQTYCQYFGMTEDTYVPSAGYWYIKWNNTLLLLFLVLQVIVVGCILTHAIPKKSEFVAVLTDVESKVRHYEISEGMKARWRQEDGDTAQVQTGETDSLSEEGTEASKPKPKK